MSEKIERRHLRCVNNSQGCVGYIWTTTTPNKDEGEDTLTVFTMIEIHPEIKVVDVDNDLEAMGSLSRNKHGIQIIQKRAVGTSRDYGSIAWEWDDTSQSFYYFDGDFSIVCHAGNVAFSGYPQFDVFWKVKDVIVPEEYFCTEIQALHETVNKMLTLPHVIVQLIKEYGLLVYFSDYLKLLYETQNTWNDRCFTKKYLLKYAYPWMDKKPVQAFNDFPRSPHPLFHVDLPPFTTDTS